MGTERFLDCFQMPRAEYTHDARIVNKTKTHYLLKLLLNSEHYKVFSVEKGVFNRLLNCKNIPIGQHVSLQVIDARATLETVLTSSAKSTFLPDTLATIVSARPTAECELN